MKAQRATSARLAAGKKPALTSKTNTSTTSSTGSASSSTKSSLLQQQQQPSSSTTIPFLDLIDYTFSDNHLMIESNFNSYKLASATFGEAGKGNTTTSEHHKFICGREIGKGSYSKIYTIENSSSSENLSSTSSLSSSTTPLSSSSSPLALRLTSSNLMSRLDRENQILKIIHRAQQSSKSSSLINTNVVRVFGAGSLRPTDQQQKQNLYNGSSTGNNHQDVLNNNNHAFSAIHLIELLRSETLYQLMTQVGSAFTIIDVYEIMLGCAQAVNELHKLDIVHRDIKLDNFVFANNNNNNNNNNTRHMIKLIDFGTAATVSPSTSTTNLPPEELNCGTPAYMSVEAARNVLGTSSSTKQQLTKAVDNWALGIIFYSLLTMSSPWKLEHKQQHQQQSSSTTATRTASSRSNRGGGGAAARGIMSLPPTPQGTADTKQQQSQQQSQQQMSQSQIMMHRIVKCDWHWPPADKQRHNANLNHITSKDAKQIVESLLQPDPSKRMTSDQLVLKLRQMISKEENNAGTSSSSSRTGGVRSITQNKENGNSSMFGNSNHNNNNTNRSGAIIRFLELKSNNSLTSTASYFQQQQQSQQQSSQSQSQSQQQQQQPRQSLLLMMSKPPLPVSSTSSSSAPNNNNDKLQQDAAATTRTSNSTTTTAAVSASPQARKATLLIPPVLTEQEQEQEQEKPLPSRKSSSLSKKKSSTGNTTVVSPGVTSVADNTDAAAATAPVPVVPLNKTEYNKLLKEYNKARKIITDEEKEAWEWIPYLHEANMKQAKHAHTFKKKVLKVDDDGEGFYCDQCSKLCTPPKDKKDLTSKHKDEFCSMHCYGCDMDVCMECYDTYMSRRTCSHCQKKFSWLKDIAEHDCDGATKKESGKRRQRIENDDENEKEEAATKKTSTTRGGRRSQKVVGFVKSVDDENDDDDDALEQGDDGVTRTKNRKDDDDNNGEGPKKPFNDANADEEDDDEEAAAARIEQTYLNSLPLVDQQRLPYATSSTTRKTQSRRSRSKSAIDNNNNEDAAAVNTKRGRSSSATTAANHKKGKHQHQQQRTLNWVRRVRRVENHPNSLVEDCFFYTITKGRHCAMFLSNDFPYHTVITAVQQGVAWFISNRRPNQQQQEDDDADAGGEEEFIVEKVNFEATRTLPLSDPKRRATETCKELAIEENTYNRNRRSLSACHDSIATSCFSSTDKDLADIRNAETLPIEFITDIRVEIMSNGSFKTNEDSSSSSFDEYNVDPSSSSYCLVLTLNDGRLQTLPGATQQQQQPNQKNNDTTTSVLFTINNFELHGYQIEEEVEVDVENEQQEDSAMPPLTRKRNVVEYFDGGLAAVSTSSDDDELDGNNKKTSKKKKRSDLGFGGGIELKDDDDGHGGNKSSTTSFERELTERAKKLGFRF